MIRPLTSIALLLAAGAGLYLYHVKHRTLLLDRQIAATLRETEALRAKEGMLQAEWALLNQPDRLADLAARHLALKPLAPAQFVPLAELDRHLPPVVLASTAPAGDDEGAVVSTTDAPATDGPAMGAPMAVAKAKGEETGVGETRPPSVAALAPPLPAVLAHGAGPRAAASRKPLVPAAPGGDAAGPALRVAAASAALHRPTPPAIAPRPVVASVLRPVAASVLIDPPRPARAPQTAVAPVPAVGSALGGPHAALPPPVPPQSRAEGP